MCVKIYFWHENDETFFWEIFFSSLLIQRMQEMNAIDQNALKLKAHLKAVKIYFLYMSKCYIILQERGNNQRP